MFTAVNYITVVEVAMEDERRFKHAGELGPDHVRRQFPLDREPGNYFGPMLKGRVGDA
jgi:hypothetical protein